jgi:hypothetical protein
MKQSNDWLYYKKVLIKGEEQATIPKEILIAGRVA